MTTIKAFLCFALFLTHSIITSAEVCRISAPMPGATYSAKDLKKQQELCAIDFDDPTVALCPKTWSTSAATSIYGVKALGITSTQFETSSCKGKVVPSGTKKLGKFKQNMNTEGTSAIWIKGIQTYFHLSRYLGTQVEIPPVVYKEMNADQHLKRVSQFGPARAKSAMNKTAWNWIIKAEKNPSSVPLSMGFFTADLKNIRGVVYKDQGDRYGYEFIGSDDWGLAGSQKYLKTAPYRALRFDGDLKTAVQAGLSAAGRSGKNSTLQMVSWMRDLTEISVLDYILSQQDRFGNIDYEKKYVYVENNEVKTRDFKDGLAGIEQFKPQVLQVSQLGDNDASVHPGYVNFTKNHGYLNDLHHFSAKIYTRLFELEKDFKGSRSVAVYLKSELGLTDKEIAKIESQLSEVNQVLRRQCQKGKLRFDLDRPKQILVSGLQQISLNCDSPQLTE